jgi:hypothetical protein
LSFIGLLAAMSTSSFWLVSPSSFFAEYSWACLFIHRPLLNVAVTINEKESAVNEQNQGV